MLPRSVVEPAFPRVARSRSTSRSSHCGVRRGRVRAGRRGRGCWRNVVEVTIGVASGGSRWPGSRSRGRHPTPAGAAVVAGMGGRSSTVWSCRGNRRTTRNYYCPQSMRWPRCGVGAQQCSSEAGSSQCGSPTPLRPGRHRDPSAPTARLPLYLGGELRRDLVAEPLLCPVVPAGAPWPPGSVGGPRRSPR